MMWPDSRSVMRISHLIFPSALSSAARSMKERQWEEQQEASSAFAFNLSVKEEQKEKEDEVACSALWSGTYFSVTHVCIV